MILDKADTESTAFSNALFLPKKHESTWELYYQQYSYALLYVMSRGLQGNYVFNKMSRPLLFLVRHQLELCVKLNLANIGLDVPITHDFAELLAVFPDPSILPSGFEKVLLVIDKDPQGSSFRYEKDKITGDEFFKNGDVIDLSEMMIQYETILRQTQTKFFTLRICDHNGPFERMKRWDLTLHMGENRYLGQIRTQYDFMISFLIDGIVKGEVDSKGLYLPLLFLIRHSLELALKANIEQMNEMFAITTKQDLKDEHSLVRLYNCYENFLKNIDPTLLNLPLQDQLHGFMRNYNTLNQAIHQLDSNSKCFRYPFDKNGLAIRLSMKNIELANFIRLYQFTDPFLTFTNYVLAEL